MCLTPLSPPHVATLPPGRVFVDHYANSALKLLLPAVEDGIFDDNWRIRQSSALLLGKLLFKVGAALQGQKEARAGLGKSDSWGRERIGWLS